MVGWGEEAQCLVKVLLKMAIQGTWDGGRGDVLPQSVGRQADLGRSPAGINTARGQSILSC